MGEVMAKSSVPTTTTQYSMYRACQTGGGLYLYFTKAKDSNSQLFKCWQKHGLVMPK
jgi:hypothetical protein